MAACQYRDSKENLDTLPTKDKKVNLEFLVFAVVLVTMVWTDGLAKEVTREIA